MTQYNPPVPGARLFLLIKSSTFSLFEVTYVRKVNTAKDTQRAYTIKSQNLPGYQSALFFSAPSCPLFCLMIWVTSNDQTPEYFIYLFVPFIYFIFKHRNILEREIVRYTSHIVDIMEYSLKDFRSKVNNKFPAFQSHNVFIEKIYLSR